MQQYQLPNFAENICVTLFQFVPLIYEILNWKYNNQPDKKTKMFIEIPFCLKRVFDF